MKHATFAERLADAMTRLHLKQSDLLQLAQPFCEQESVRMNRSDLSQYLQGKTTPNPDKLYVLAEALDVDMAWLLGHDVPMRKEVTVISFDDIPGVMPVSDAERRLVGLYRRAGEVWRSVAEEVLAAHQITDEM